ncbi:two-component regulator propeller domain-containing protein [uncultured Bacteroides sp.]|uniref:two-component regulator propeller domain-containing protein n=1 Tax=uncultured Bacteroides sp. TaxID=162156 RepID=UPI00261D5896|nr:two-component regulator propeller domain-containing protein [uncultured Bacteroides sp.]
MKKRLCSTFIVLFVCMFLKAQMNCTFTHYSLENGLSENSVMDMVQDHDGLIWFATWDGVNRFDGYDFKVYKATPENDLMWSSNRVDHLCVDKAGDVWCLTYDGRVFRFDKRMETFTEVPENGEGANLKFSSIVVLENGTVWLLAGSDGGVRVTSGPEGKLVTEAYLSTVTDQKSEQINAVVLDGQNREWLLTDNGLYRIDGKTGKSTPFFVNSQSRSPEFNQPFYSAVVLDGSIFFGSNLGRIWEFSVKGDLFNLKELDVKDDVVALCPLQKRNIVIATRRQGFAVADKRMNSISYYNGVTGFDFGRYPIQSVYVDSHDEVWFNVRKIGGVCHFNSRTGRFKIEQVLVERDAADRSQPAFGICEDTKGNLWVHPHGGGLSLFDREKDELVPFYDEIGSSSWRFSNKLHAMMIDRQDNLWLGTHSKGLEKITFYKTGFDIVKPLDCNYHTNANQVRSLCEDSNKRFWVGTRDGKIAIYDSHFTLLGYLQENGSIGKSGALLNVSAYKIMEDSKGVMWIATKGNGVMQLVPQGNGYNIRSYTYDVNDIYSLSHNSVYDICEDHSGRIWVVTFGGGLNYIERQADGSFRFISHRNNLKSYPMERCLKARRILIDKQGILWIATSNGLVSFSEKFSRPENIKFKLYYRISDKGETLSNNDIYDILLTKQNRLLFATFGGGLNELIGYDEAGNARFKSYTMQNGLLSDVLFSLSEDENGNVWIGSEGGLTQMNGDNHHFENFLKQELGDELFFEEATSMRAADGRLLFGTNKGILAFLPKDIRKNNYVPELILSGLKIDNQLIVPGEGSVLSESLNSLAHLTLSHKDNTIAISFAALDMSYPDNVRYAYILEGFDKDWNYVGKQRTATYTNLPYGDYKLRVKSTNGAGVWVDNEHVLDITIKPSFWETPMAYVLYVVLFLLILLGGTYILFVIYRLKHEVSVEQQLTDMKLRFFTNISHELRTPLTLIEGPVELVLKRDDLNPEVRDQLQVIERNTHRMLRMVNQILDFRKIQNNKMKLTVEQIDIVAFVRKIMANFEAIAETNKIDFIFETECPSLKLWVDPDKVEKMVFNLLSNAFKYTPNGKCITVFVRENEKSVVVGVQDQGIGISAKKRDSLFVRFETLLDKNLFNQNSSGIGLSLVKELVDLHRAKIHVDSKEGEGSCFTIEFLKDKEHYPEGTEFIVSDNVEVDKKEGLIMEQPTMGTSDSADMSGNDADTSKNLEKPVPELQTILLVEDNLELRFFLRSIFNSRFNILEASNGKEGLDIAIKYGPDLIVSDILMPEMDGIEMTKELRKNLLTSHISIILLTAKTDTDSKLLGMELGVDSYITKPFSATYLEARVDNLLARRAKLQKYYCEHLMDIKDEMPAEEKEEVDTMSAQDRQFMEKLTGLMERNMDNGDLVVDDLVREMAVSRSVFFKKLKSLTGLAPVEFIKEMRVKRAAQLIETGEFNMTQISYMVGINDPRYFSKCFKQRYGMTPTEYKDKIRGK